MEALGWHGSGETEGPETDPPAQYPGPHGKRATLPIHPSGGNRHTPYTPSHGPGPPIGKAAGQQRGVEKPRRGRQTEVRVSVLRLSSRLRPGASHWASLTFSGLIWDTGQPALPGSRPAPGRGCT